jgi:hypothetical protein
MKQLILSYILFLTCSTFGQSAVKVLINTTTPADTINRTVQVDPVGNFKVVNTREYASGINWMLKTSKIDNDAGFITAAPVQSVNGQTGVVSVFDGNYNNLTNKPDLFSGAYNDLSGKPTIPTNNNQLTNGSGFLNQSGVRGAITVTTVGTGSASYNNTSGVLNVPTPNIPAQFNPSNGTGINITGIYPNQVFSSTITQSGQLYSKTALLGTGVTVVDTFTISSATPTVSFTSILATTGKTNFKVISATGYRASATAINSPNVAVTSITTNSATFIITQQNTSTVTILGINILSGLPMILVPDPVNVKLILSLIAY